MRLFFAGSFSGMTEDRLKEIGIRNKLYSYSNEPNSAKKWGGEGLLLDSGAFTAYTKGIKIFMSALNHFILTYKPELAIQLDVIGDPEASWKNWVKQSEHVKTMPVIHHNATADQIRRVLTATDHICLGALVGVQKETLFKWLDYIFSFQEIRGKKIHALGVMAEDILIRYPFYSADSSSALSVVRYPIDPEKDPMMFMRQKSRHYTDLYAPMVRKQLQLEKKLTRIWEKRGIIWT
jgi:hypothetical protein